jgi:hypothetical protein
MPNILIKIQYIEIKQYIEKLIVHITYKLSDTKEPKASWPSSKKPTTRPSTKRHQSLHNITVTSLTQQLCLSVIDADK